VEGKWITYGGYFGGLVDPCTSVEMFDPHREKWTQMTASGTPPSGVFGAACVAVGPVIYHICGHDGENNYNTIHCLDTTVIEWRKLQPANMQAAPMKKSGTAGISYMKSVITVGGYGDLPIYRPPGVKYTPWPGPRRDGRGRTNEVVCYGTEHSKCILCALKHL
jgi:hypothetical protein